ncbi:putative thioesterase involved in non-ribosomal peptide biosynthesis [Herbaspirillum sp. CF444]|uniref:thioesterase II family protein n=1 Tax=Herbaspirillum sp. CF444 TaxID=1144319 RepID=UPI00027262D3|nr:thioesterase domain-containing protein [Herbaspirillum sp. CF444]EJL94056.1 putative thioesterase involved in non-ribosomal peptide biosynthesis [Herbaspirillum sp. CF444]
MPEVNALPVFLCAQLRRLPCQGWACTPWNDDFLMTAIQESRAWFPFGAGGEDAHTRLFCLPFAGGGASNFLPWRARLAEAGVGVAPVQYPGHETRLGEAPLHAWEEMLAALQAALVPLLDRPYALFGYSMGARLAFALAARLAAAGMAPVRLIVAAHVPPDLPSPALQAAGLDDQAFKALLLRYGGIPAEISHEQEFWDLTLPLMRADFALAAAPLDADADVAAMAAAASYPIAAYAGIDDVHADAKSMAGWGRFTTAGFILREFAGDHFFLRGADVCQALNTDLALARSADLSSLVSA